MGLEIVSHFDYTCILVWFIEVNVMIPSGSDNKNTANILPFIMAQGQAGECKLSSFRTLARIHSHQVSIKKILKKKLNDRF